MYGAAASVSSYSSSVKEQTRGVIAEVMDHPRNKKWLLGDCKSSWLVFANSNDFNWTLVLAEVIEGRTQEPKVSRVVDWHKGCIRWNTGWGWLF